LLKKEVYKGVQVYGAKSKRGAVTATCAEIVPAALWESARERLHRGYQQSGLGPDAGHLLTGLIYCSACGMGMGGAVMRNRYQTEYRYYRCYTVRTRPRCAAGFIPMPEADERAWRQVVHLLSDPELVFRAAEERLREREKASAPGEKEALDLRLVQLRLEQERLVAAIRRGHIPIDMADQGLAEIAALETTLRLQRNALSDQPVPTWREDAEEMILEARELLAEGVSPTQRRILLRLLCKRVVAHRGAEWVAEWKFLPQGVYNNA
jgi:hypothetical protein